MVRPPCRVYGPMGTALTRSRVYKWQALINRNDVVPETDALLA